MKKPYWKRVLITVRELALSWPHTLPACTSSLIGAFCEFVGAFVGLLLALVIPFTFMFAPLWLWCFERGAAKRKAEAMLASTMRHD